MPEENYQTKKNKKKRDFHRIKIGGAVLCAGAFLAANAWLYAGGMHAYQDASQKIDTVKTEEEKNVQALAAANAEISRLQNENQKLQKENSELQKEKEEADSWEVMVGQSGSIDVEVTAYTLSETSCNKGVDHPAYGKTKDGTDLQGEDLESAKAIAVDPAIIPLGSYVKICFKDPEMQRFNGIYKAVDTGGAIKGNRIDLFAGDGAETLAMNIGRRQAVAQIV